MGAKEKCSTGKGTKAKNAPVPVGERKKIMKVKWGQGPKMLEERMGKGKISERGCGDKAIVP